MKDYYAEYLLMGKILKLLHKEQTAKSIIKKTKLPVTKVYRILKSLEKHHIITIRNTKTKDNKHYVRLYKIKNNPK